MQKLLIKCFFFVLPLGILFVFPAVLVIASGEYHSLAFVIRMQRNDARMRIFQQAFWGSQGPFKRGTILDRRPEILTLGTSRVEGFRSAMFRPGVNFYNGAFAAAGFQDYANFLDSLPGDYAPRILIVGLEQLNFNSAERKVIKKFASNDTRTSVDNIVRGDWRTLYRYMFTGKITPSHIRNLLLRPNSTYVGLQAKVDRSGFRNDGSYRWGPLIDDPHAYAERQKFVDNIAASVMPNQQAFEYDASVPPEALLDLRTFLVKAKARHIHVIGYLTPVAHRIYAQIVALPADDLHRISMEKIPAAVRPIFALYGFDFFDFTDIEAIGSSDAEMLDQVHGTDTHNLRLLLHMAEHSRILQPSVDIPYLKSRLQSAAANTKELFGEEL